MIKTWFFGGEPGQEPEYNQASQAEFQSLFMLRNGYVPGKMEELKVVPTVPAGMKVNVSKGAGWIEGYGFALTDPEEVAIAAADPTNPRIDRIVARLDSVAGREIKLMVLKGTAAGSPAPPALTRTAQVYDISLAQIAVGKGVASIGAGAIADERGDGAICGKAIAPGIETFFEGRIIKDVSGGADIVLTTEESANVQIVFTGLLTKNIKIIFPSTEKVYYVQNRTMGNYTLTCKTAAGLGAEIQQSDSSIYVVVSDGTDIMAVGSTASKNIMTRDEDQEMAAKLVAQSNTDYGVRQVRNSFFSTSNPQAGLGQSGDIFIKYV